MNNKYMTPYAIDKACRGGSDVKREKKRDPRKTAVRMADKYASLVTRLDGKCALAGFIPGHVCKGSLVCGHLFSRVAYSTRWDEENLYCICSWTNIRMEDDPIVARQLLHFAESKWGVDNIEILHRAYNKAVPVKTNEIQEIADTLKYRYERLTEGDKL